MNKIKAIIIGVAILVSMAFPSMVANSAVTCFKSGEQTSGMNKICYYNCMGSTAAITISAVKLCPLTIRQ
ncbi:hypothetical protein ABXT63_04310 [Candidatus Pelagibacter sp. Uisw_092]|uniref:hypothetical protein n=1 Tax=Candidatus Pelagibacter sp. Uisw_092 TaxID=3230979 RepID=UPI0039EB9C54